MQTMIRQLRWPLPLWMAALVASAMVAIYGNHLSTGRIPDRVMFTQFGVVDVYWVGVIVLGATLCGIMVAGEQLWQKQSETDRTTALMLVHHLIGIIFWILIWGSIGARIYYTFTPAPSRTLVGIQTAADYWSNPSLLLNIQDGGLALLGAIIGGLIGGLIYLYRHRLPLLLWLDSLTIGFLFAVSIGRWAHFLNQDLYGWPTMMPWALTIDVVHRLPEYVDVARFHPVFLYQSLWHLLGFVYLYRRQQALDVPAGLLFIDGLMIHLVGRFWSEFLRVNVHRLELAPISVPTDAVVAAVLLSILVGVRLQMRNR